VSGRRRFPAKKPARVDLSYLAAGARRLPPSLALGSQRTAAAGVDAAADGMMPAITMGRPEARWRVDELEHEHKERAE
jgi:hypothetical protein